MRSFWFAWRVQKAEGAGGRAQLLEASASQKASPPCWMGHCCLSAFTFRRFKSLWMWDMVERRRRMRWGGQEDDIHTAAVLHCLVWLPYTLLYTDTQPTPGFLHLMLKSLNMKSCKFLPLPPSCRMSPLVGMLLSWVGNAAGGPSHQAYMSSSGSPASCHCSPSVTGCG